MITRARRAHRAGGAHAAGAPRRRTAGGAVPVRRLAGAEPTGRAAPRSRDPRQQDNGSILLAVIRDCSWLAWLLFAVSVLAEAQARDPRPPVPRLRLGGLQGAAARLVALAALTFAAPSGITLTASAAVVSAQHGITPTPEPAAAPIAAPADLASVGLRADSRLEAPNATRLMTVHTGDCLWSIAQRYLGAGERYPEIVSLNYGHDMGDGLIFTNPSLIEPGWRLLLPGGSATGAAHAGQAIPAARPPAAWPEARRPASATSQHLGHASQDPHYRRRHPAACRSRTGSPAPAIDPARELAKAERLAPRVTAAFPPARRSPSRPTTGCPRAASGQRRAASGQRERRSAR